MSVQNLDDDERNVELQKRNLSLPTIDLEPELERTDFESTSSVNQLASVKKARKNQARFSFFKKTAKDEDALRARQEASKSMHLPDWPSKMRIWHNLKEQLPAKNHQNYHLLGRKFKSKSGDLICDSQSFERSNGRRNSWWFGLDAGRHRKDSCIEIVSLKQHSIKDPAQVQHFVNSEVNVEPYGNANGIGERFRKSSAHSIRSDKFDDDSRYDSRYDSSSRFVDSGGDSSNSKSDLTNDKSDSKDDLSGTGDLNNNNRRLRNSSGENCGSEQSDRADCGGCFQVDEDQDQNESGLKVSLYFRFVFSHCATTHICKWWRTVQRTVR